MRPRSLEKEFEMLKKMAIASLLMLVAGNLHAQEEGANGEESNLLPKTLVCFVHYQTKGEAGLSKGVNLVGGDSELRQNDFFGGFSADLSQFTQYNEQPKKLQHFSLVGISTDNRVEAVFDVSLNYWYNLRTKNLSMVGVTLRLAKDNKGRDSMQKRLEHFDKSYQLSIQQEFSARREITSRFEMPNPNKGSRITYVSSECSLE